MSNICRRTVLLAALVAATGAVAPAGGSAPTPAADRASSSPAATGPGAAGGDAAATDFDTTTDFDATADLDATAGPGPAGGAAPSGAGAAGPRGARRGAARVAAADSVLVRFRSDLAPAARRAAVGRLGASGATGVGASGLTRVAVTGDATAAAARLRRDPAVAEVAVNHRRRLTFVPDDTRYAAEQAGNLGVLRLPAAWDVERDAADQIVAVVDTGVDGTHPDLAGRLVAGCNTVGTAGGCQGSTGDANTAKYEGAGHGTMVAGIIGAATNNATGVAGVTSAAKIMPIKVFGPDAAAPGELTATDDDVIEGVRWAADHGATVINLSLGGSEPGALGPAMTYARSKGAVVVAAAGNSGAESPEYPAAFSSVLAVAATDSAARLTEFSTRGDWVDIAAPGFDVASTFPGDKYEAWSGTSFSAPLVAGVAALARSADGLDDAATFSRIVGTARDAGPRGTDPFYGHGLVDAAAAVGAPALPPGPGVAEVPQPDMTDDANGFPARATAFTGSSTAGTIGIEGDVDWYRRPASPGRRVSVRVTPPSYVTTKAANMDPVLLVYDQDLRLLDVADDPFDATATETSTLTTPAGTTALYLAVHSYHGARDSRSYTLSAGTPAAAPRRARGTAAWIRDISPAPYAVAQSAAAAPRVVFHRAMKASSVTAATVRLRDGRTGAFVPATVTYRSATRTATLDPVTALTATGPYRVEVGSVRDAQGTVYTGRARSAFRVGVAPVTGLAVTATPDNGAQDIDLDWTNPAIGTLDKVVVRYVAGAAVPGRPSLGAAVYDSDDAAQPSDVHATVQDLAGPTHTFAVFTVDETGLYSAPVVGRVSAAAVALRASATPVTYGAAVTLTGTVRHAGTLALSGAAVKLEFVPAGVGVAAHVSNLTTDATGAVVYRLRPAASGTYRLRYLGAAGAALVAPATGYRPVAVRVAVTGALARAAAARGATVAFTGAVAPDHAGGPVRLQERSGGTWHDVATATLDADSRYHFAVRAAVRGVHTLRAYCPGDGDHAGGASPSRQLTVT
ncbi:hypothetical protein GCM10010124_17980 [Pilimelia terevasa]|uniref:Subtilisin n=1 Tax=Pilimelia terevasa TaxID=53372 RepID=A0A8J3BKF5_9ACTN|nr:S8 family serine peptidase [Pilimelia terevasa]GGK25867.1 hypothetical protein GCM10010124_17980 [Pilimelia terevasa]